MTQAENVIGSRPAPQVLARFTPEVVPAGNADAELVFDFDGAGRAVFGCLLDAVLGAFRYDVDLGLGRVAVDFEDVRATADAQLAAGAQLFVDRCFHADLHSRPAGVSRPAQFVQLSGVM